MINTDKYFLDIARAVARQSTCLDKQVGCVIVSQDNQIISCGYNDAPSKCPECTRKSVCFKEKNGFCMATHAEINALIKAGERAKGGYLYVTLEPCFECAKAIINAKISEVYYSQVNGHNLRRKAEMQHLFGLVGISLKYI